MTIIVKLRYTNKT